MNTYGYGWLKASRGTPYEEIKKIGEAAVEGWLAYFAMVESQSRTESYSESYVPHSERDDEHQ